jgi:hypothetical protein
VLNIAIETAGHPACFPPTVMPNIKAHSDAQSFQTISKHE